MTATLTERVPRYILHFQPSWAPSVALLRFAQFQSLRQKQGLRYFNCHENRLSFLNLECVPYHHQKAFITKTSSLSDMEISLSLASSRQEQKHGTGIHEYVHETALQSLVLAPNVQEAREAIVENAETELNVVTSTVGQIVYKRRSKKAIAAEKALTVTKTVEEELLNSEAMACVVSSEEQTEEAITKASRKTGRKRKVTSKVSECTEASQYAELGTAASSGKRKVGARTVTDPASGSQRRKARVKGSQCIEHLDSLSQKIEESNTEATNVEVATANGFKEHTVDTLVEKVNPWLLLVHKKVQSEWSVYNPHTMRQSEPQGKSMKLLSWNVNGLRALLKRKGEDLPGSAILRLAQKENFDVLSLQETKLQEKDVVKIKETLLPAYDNSLWSCSTAKLGYSGTAVISRIKPLSISYGIGIPKHDSEGRVITVEFENFFLVTCYVPNSGQKLERLVYRTQDWDLSLGIYLKALEKEKPVILTGDLNCAHQEIDIYNPDGNRRSAGFTDEERTSFEENFLHNGFHDTFRKLHPNAVAYTYWGYRTVARPKNHGWRLDYYLASDALLDLVHDSYTLPHVEGSDHCPIGLILKM
ncbi:hypothetical protein GOP47_0020932 [Adiantum capillus-veneris]|uniref:DNA-(apurinic or apyrimidinic site) endonuclease n=1 Tax=Adiantum capillus-veneris TaxID=13818 RepID=A0A9D4UAH8_ADICA|nr:hypothetical protein GOP47_0020932 [Adiantum capillus-veneris]